MSFIDRCPACERRIYWGLSKENAKGGQCPACKALLVERRSFQKMNSWGIYLLNVAHIFLFFCFRIDHMRHEKISDLLLSLYGVMLLSSGGLFAYANLFAERYATAGENESMK